MRRRVVDTGVRDRYTDHVRDLADRFGHLEGCPWPAELARLEAGERVVVEHGWEIDFVPPTSGPFVLEPDGPVVQVPS